MITRSAASGLGSPCVLPARCNVKESMMVTNIRKTRRNLSSGRLPVERGGCGGDGERNRREVDMSASTKTNGNKGATVVVNGGHRRCGGEGGSVPIVEKMGGSSSSSIVMKRECNSYGDRKKKRGKPSHTDLHIAVENSGRYSFPSSSTDDVIILEHVNSPRTPVKNPSHLIRRFFTPQATGKCRSSSVSPNDLQVEDMCFSNLLDGNCVSPRPNFSADHSPKNESYLCRTAILKNALASGVFPKSPSEIDADGLSQWYDTLKNLDKTMS